MSYSTINIIIVEDHLLVRKALAGMLEEHPRFKVVAEAGNGKELLDLLKVYRPDVVLLDIEMPVMNGHDTLANLRRQYPHIKVIVLSMHNEMTYMSEFLSKGARAYVPKDASEENLRKAIQAVHREGHYFDENVSRAMLKTLQNEKPIDPFMDERSLSKREVEILKELCDGKTNKEIAVGFSITATTVNFHRVNIYKKTRSRNITDLIRYSIKNGVIEVN